MRLFRRTFSASLCLVLCTSAAFAHREDYIDETLVFLTLDRGEAEAEYWFDVGRDDEADFTRHNVAFEYGITDHWMVDTRITGLDRSDDSFQFDSGRVETRYRFYDEGTLPIDIAVSGEVNTQRDEQDRDNVGIEPRLILSKDFGELNLTANLAEEIPLSRGSSSFEVRGGWRYDATDLFRFGTELRYDTLEHSVGVIPQVWLTFPHDVTLKAGYSYDFSGTHERFFRFALEIGF